MPVFTQELRDSLILFFLATGFYNLYYLSGYILPILMIYYPYGFIVHIASYAAEFVTIYLYIKLVKKTTLANIGFRRTEKWRKHFILGLILAVFHNATILMFSIFILKIEHRFYYLPFYINIPVYFVVFLLLSVSEEVIFRGCILGELLNRYETKVSIIFSSLLFSIYRFSYFSLPSLLSWPYGTLMTTMQTFSIFMVGILNSYFYYKTDRNLLGPITYNFSYNFFFVPLAGMRPAMPPLLFQLIIVSVDSLLIMIEILILRRFLILKNNSSKRAS
ncbi:MAG: type II CAAX endopeptidase family protein [Thermoproteota archaeon]